MIVAGEVALEQVFCYFILFAFVNQFTRMQDEVYS